MSERTDDLPAGWAMATLGEVVSPSKEKIEPAEEPGAAYLSLEHIESHTNQILGHGLSEDVTSTKAVFQKGDVLYGRLRPYLNKVCRPDFGGVCSTDILVFHDSPAVVGEFLLYFLTQRSFVNYATQNAQGINLPRISWDAIADYPFPLPPRPEQERIIKKVATLRSRCRCSSGELNALPSLLENLRQSVLAAAFRGDLTADWRAKNPDVEPATLLLDRIRAECRRKWEKAELVKMQKKGSSPSDEAWKQRYEEPTSIGLTGLPELPQGWCWTTFGEAFGVRVGATPSRKEAAYWRGTIPWVSSGEVAFCRITATRESITPLGLENSSTEVHPPGTVLLGMIGEGKTRGQAAILDVAACNNQNSAAIRVALTPIPPEYVYLYLQMDYQRTRTLGSGNNQPALNKSRVEAMRFPLAPLAEMKEMVGRLGRMLTFSGSVVQAIKEAEEQVSCLDQSILAKAFRGELVPQDPNDEPASVLLERIRAERTATGDGAKPKRPARGKRGGNGVVASAGDAEGA